MTEGMVLGTIAYSTNEFGMSSIPIDFYTNPDKNLDVLEEYDVAYLFKVKFID